MKILVTGSAGFIGFHLVKYLLEQGHEIVGLDSINDYYDVSLKYGRLAITGIEQETITYNELVTSKTNPKYRFTKLQLEDKEAIYTLFKTEKFDKVCHLAAQAGVRYSLENPHAYINSNITGFLNILEASRLNEVEHLTYASSSSVYGKNTQVPYSTTDNVDNPVSLYAATKKANELMAHTYSHLYNLPTTGLRFFTVYGPWGRPDMAIYKFTKRIMNDDAIDVYNYGNMSRDFTYIDDIVEGVVRILEKPTSEQQKYKVYNIGNNAPVQLLDFIKAIENSIGKEAKKNMMPLQMGDVLTTWADTNDLINDFDYKPNTSIEFGIKQFIDWYKDFHQIV